MELNPRFPIYYLFLAVLTTSCAIFKNDPARKLNAINKNDFEKAEGEFANFPTTTNTKIARDLSGYDKRRPTLWGELTGRSQFKDSTGTLKTQTVSLDFISKNRVHTSLFQNGELINQKTIRGSVRRGYFYYKRRFFVIPFFPLLYSRNHDKYRLGITKENCLVVDYTWNYAIFALIAGDYSKGQTTAEFSKIDSK